MVREGFKMTELGEIPTEWIINKLEEVCEKVFVGIATSTTDSYTKEEGIPIIRNQNIKEDRLDTTDILKITSEFSELNSNKKLKTGDILTARTGYPGTSCVVPKEFEGTHSFTTLISRPIKGKVLSEYLSRYINSEQGKRAINSVKAGGAQQNLNVSVFTKIPIVVPSLLEQQKITEILSIVDEQLEQTDQLIEKTTELKKGLMQKLLTKGIGHTEFKQTEVGEVPSEWDVRKVKEVCNTTSGGTPSRAKKEFYNNGKIPWIKTGELKRKYLYDSEEKITEEAVKNSSAKLLKKDTLLIAMYGATIGNISILKVEASTNQACCAINPNEEVLITEFLYYYLLFNKEKIISLGAGGAQPNISQQIIKDIQIGVPPIQEQRKIADILSSIDNQMGEYNIKKEKLELLKKGLMQQLLTGKIRVTV